MENSLNQTQSSMPTSNPQGAASANGASNATDFQATASPEALNSQAESLSVQETGDPLEGGANITADGGFSVMLTVGIIAAVIIVGWIFYKLMKEAIEEDSESNSRPAVKASKSSVAKKSTTKKKPAASKRTSKTTRKKR